MLFSDNENFFVAPLNYVIDIVRTVLQKTQDQEEVVALSKISSKSQSQWTYMLLKIEQSQSKDCLHLSQLDNEQIVSF